MRREELAEAAAFAAFLSDLSTFLNDEPDHATAASLQSLSENHVTRTVFQDESEIESTCLFLEDEAERKRALRNIKAGKRRDAYRKHLKEEWQTLRTEEVELAAKLEELQHKRRTDTGKVARSAWRAMAMRQLESRRIAEAHQEKLRAAVKRRREVIEDVENTLRKRLKESKEGHKSENSCTSKKEHEPTDERLFEAYLDELDVIYAKTDAVFQSCETEPKMGPFLNTKPLKKKDGESEYFENFGVLDVPFDFERTCLGLWEVTRQPYRQLDREVYHGGGVDDNTIAVRFRVKCELQTGGMVSLLSHFVARRYFEERREVTIWRELWEGEGEFHGMHSDETGWCIIEPSEKSTNAVSSSSEVARNVSTIVKTCARLVPMHFSTNISWQPDFDRFTEVLVTSGKEDNHHVEQMMERLQISDSHA